MSKAPTAYAACAYWPLTGESSFLRLYGPVLTRHVPRDVDGSAGNVRHPVGRPFHAAVACRAARLRHARPPRPGTPSVPAPRNRSSNPSLTQATACRTSVPGGPAGSAAQPPQAAPRILNPQTLLILLPTTKRCRGLATGRYHHHHHHLRKLRPFRPGHPPQGPAHWGRMRCLA